MREILDERCIALELTGRKKPEIIAELVDTLIRGVAVSDPELLTRELVDREKLSTTGIGSGIAIPHALSGTVEETALAFGRKLEGTRFDAVDNQPVALFFLLVGPKGTHTEHLRLLSRLSRYLHNPTFRQRLLDATSADEVLQAFADREQSV
jgi:fructose-specific phosphotransferase system IIA component